MHQFANSCNLGFTSIYFLSQKALIEKKLIYSPVLGFVDIARNENRMQLLESNYLICKWKFFSSNMRRSSFYSVNFFHFKYWVFESWGRTGPWLLTINTYAYGKLNEALEKFNTVYENKAGNKFGLLTFEKQPNKLESLMCSCDSDLQQMALGKISANQIKMAMGLLCAIGEELVQQKASTHESREASNEFYTLILHTFGVNRPPIIDSTCFIIKH